MENHVSQEDSFFPFPQPPSSIEDSFSNSETGELEEILWRLASSLPSDRCLDWKESRERYSQILQELSQTEKNEQLLEILDGVEYKVGGDEHQLFHVDQEPGRIYKATYEDSFGCRSAFDAIDPDLTGKQFNATLNNDPRFYLQRWIILNSLGDYKTRFEGILPPERANWTPRICVSQPWIEGINPIARSISRSMKSLGFLEVSQDAFYLPESKILLTDTAPRNVRILREGLIPFDAIAEFASEEVVEWINTKFGIQ